MSGKVNKEFWLGQLFTLLATVVGVYLAANSGFEKAIEFENLQHQRDVYHVQQSLLGEMQVNTERLQSWVDEFDKAPQSNSMSMQPDKYRWIRFSGMLPRKGLQFLKCHISTSVVYRLFTSVQNICAASCYPVTRLKRRKLRRNCAS